MGTSPGRIDRNTGVSYNTARKSQRPSPGQSPNWAGTGQNLSDLMAGPKAPSMGTLNDNPYVIAPTSLTPPGPGGAGPSGSPYGSPYGNTRGGSTRGGGGGGRPMNWDALYSLIGASKPSDLTYTDLKLPEYKAPAFYDFDQSSFDIARDSVGQQIEAGRQTGNRAYEDALFELQQTSNPFGTVRTTNPGVRDAMARMMQANGVSPDINVGVDREGVQADQAFGNVQALLSAVNDQQFSSDQRALGGDQRRFNESLGQEERMLGTSIDLALARARGQYEKDLFAYGKEEADRNYQNAVQQAIANNQGQNQVNQANATLQNNWSQATANQLMDLIASGKPGMDLNKVLAALGKK